MPEYVPEILSSWEDIAKLYGAKPMEVKAWHSMGAPIVVISRRPVVFIRDLQTWLIENRGKVERDNLELD